MKRLRRHPASERCFEDDSLASDAVWLVDRSLAPGLVSLGFCGESGVASLSKRLAEAKAAESVEVEVYPETEEDSRYLYDCYPTPALDDHREVGVNADYHDRLMQVATKVDGYRTLNGGAGLRYYIDGTLFGLLACCVIRP